MYRPKVILSAAAAAAVSVLHLDPGILLGTGFWTM